MRLAVKLVTLVLLSLAPGLSAGDPPAPTLPRFGLPSLPTTEEILRSRLQRCLRAQALIQDNVELIEKDLKGDGPIRYAPEGAQQMRREVEKLREFLSQLKRQEKELLRWQEERKHNPSEGTDLAAVERLDKLYKELWPDRPTSPMPREVKSKVPAPKQ